MKGIRKLGKITREKKREMMLGAGGATESIWKDQKKKFLKKRKRLLEKLEAKEFDSEAIDLAKGIRKFLKENSSPLVARVFGLKDLKLDVDLDRSRLLIVHLQDSHIGEEDIDFVENYCLNFIERFEKKIKSGVKKIADKVEKGD